MIFGNMGDMGKMMQMAREMQGKLKQVKSELKNDMFESKSGGVRVVLNGEMELKELNIDQSELADHAKLEKNVKDAVGRALKEAKDGAARKMKGLTGGMNLPGM